MNPQRKIGERIETAASLYEAGILLVTELQASISERVIGWAVELETDGARLKYSVKNLRSVSKVVAFFKKFANEFKNKLLTFFHSGIKKLAGLSDNHFKEQKPFRRDIETLAQRRVLLRFGYDVETRELLPGSWFAKLFNTDQIARAAAAAVNNAIARKMTLAQFRDVFRKLFTGDKKSGLGGMLEQHYRTNTFDLFSRIDRAIQLEYANELGLTHAIYSGTLIETSRQFCIDRVNKVFTRKQIESWKDMNWQGKFKVGYDPYLDCGGFNCRHHLSFVSPTVARAIDPKIEI